MISYTEAIAAIERGDRRNVRAVADALRAATRRKIDFATCCRGAVNDAKALEQIQNTVASLARPAAPQRAVSTPASLLASAAPRDPHEGVTERASGLYRACGGRVPYTVALKAAAGSETDLESVCRASGMSPSVGFSASVESKFAPHDGGPDLDGMRRDADRASDVVGEASKLFAESNGAASYADCIKAASGDTDALRRVRASKRSAAA